MSKPYKYEIFHIVTFKMWWGVGKLFMFLIMKWFASLMNLSLTYVMGMTLCVTACIMCKNHLNNSDYET